MLCSKALLMEKNHHFCSICEIVGEDRFSAEPPKNIFSVQIVFMFYRESLETNYVWNLMIHKFCLERFSLR